MDAATLFEDGHNFAELAAELAKGFFCKPIEISFKQDQSPVTFADQSIEKQTRAAILEKYPDHSILGEEYGIDG